MRGGSIVAIVIVAALVIIGLFYFIDVDQTQEAQLPNVTGEGGQMPEADVETGSVDVTTEEKTVTVPDIDVNTEERTVTGPDVSVTPAPAD